MEYRTLKNNGKCACCSRSIARATEKCIVFPVDRANAYNVTLCRSCCESIIKIYESGCNDAEN